MGELWADRDRVADAAELFSEKIDVLLDRVVDSLIGRARPASTEQLRDDHTTRLLTRIAVAHHAGVDPALDVQRAVRAGMTWEQVGAATGLGAGAARARWSTEPAAARDVGRRPRRRRSSDEQQMSMW